MIWGAPVVTVLSLVGLAEVDISISTSEAWQMTPARTAT